jgi:hypothetical protein
MLSKSVKARIARNKRRRISCRTKDGRAFYRITPAAGWNNWKRAFLPQGTARDSLFAPWLKELLAEAGDISKSIPTGFPTDYLKDLKIGDLLDIRVRRPYQYKSDIFGSMLCRLDPALVKRLNETIVVFPQEGDAKQFMTLVKAKARHGEGVFKIDMEAPWDAVGALAGLLGGDIVDMKHQEEADRRVQEILTHNPDVVLSPMSDIHFGDMKRGMDAGEVPFFAIDSYADFEDDKPKQPE